MGTRAGIVGRLDLACAFRSNARVSADTHDEGRGRFGHGGDLHHQKSDRNRHVSTDAAHAYGGFLATLTAWCEHHQIPYQGVPVGTIKKHATGKGNAGKDLVIAAMTALGHAPADDNEADALALLHWAIASEEA